MSHAPIKPPPDYKTWLKRYVRKHSKQLPLSDGTVLDVPPRDLWTAILPTNDDETLGDYVPRIVGAENWAKFEADGGDFNSFMVWLGDTDEDDSGE